MYFFDFVSIDAKSVLTFCHILNFSTANNRGHLRPLGQKSTFRVLKDGQVIKLSDKLCQGVCFWHHIYEETL